MLLGSMGNLGADTPMDRAVQLSATIQRSPPAIQLNWLPNADAISYTVSRKAPDSGTWGGGIPLSAAIRTYLDESVVPGLEYEYRVVKETSLFPGYGFICAGIDTPLVDYRGKLILIVDESQAPALQAELSHFDRDLIGDGWQVIRHDVARDANVKLVKEVITADYFADPGNVTAVLLFGHVPVPYAGDFTPDGHADHLGAWPADAYYGDTNGAWTDTTANRSTAADSRNWNTPGDGKFDQTTIPSLVALQVGRVDLANMPSFAPSETELLRQYLGKNHRFRHKLFSPISRGLIDDQFSSFTEAFAADGWRNFSSLFGAQQVVGGSWFQVLQTQSYLWAYGCGPGTYNNAGSIDVPGFVNGQSNAVFTALFGSYFGDWDTADSLLRAPLANTGSGLTCAWAGRPFWYFHQMGHGHTIGYCTRITQNNSTLYPANANARGVHVALMGDPTLRLHPVAPPTNLIATRHATGRAVLSWSASPEMVAGYHVYRAPNPKSPFERLSASLIFTTTFDDPAPVKGGVYMVRAVNLQEASGGTYWNATQGVFADLDQPVVTVTTPIAVASTLGSNSAEFIFTRSGTLISPLIVQYVLGGEAINGIDYEALSGQLEIPAGSPTEVLKIVPKVETNNDTNRTVRVTAQADNSYIVGRPASAFVVIKDSRHSFRPYSGNYRGMLGEHSATVTPGDWIVVSVTPDGSFSAVIHLGAQKFSLVGTFDSSGHFIRSLGDQLGSAVELSIDLDPGAHLLSGTITPPGNPASTFIAHRELVDTETSAARGLYTVALLPESVPSDQKAPQGPGWGTLRINRHGRGIFAGVLGDGKPFSTAAILNNEGKWQLFCRLYRNRGWIGGEVTFADDPGRSDASGRLHWKREAFQGAALYSDGFAADVTLVASRFNPNKPGDWFDYQHAIGNARWMVEGGNVTSRMEGVLTIDSSGIAPIGSEVASGFALKLNKSSGLIRGGFLHSGLNTNVKFRGVALDKSKTGIACFSGSSQTGLVTVEQNPALPGSEGGGLNGDAVRPAITIDNPPAMARIPEVAQGGVFVLPSVIVSGAAADDSGIFTVEYQVLHKGNVGGLRPAAGNDLWSFPLYITADDGGDYTVVVKAIDTNGNESVLASRDFTYVVQRNLIVTVAGNGAVSGDFLGTTTREVGRDYAIQAVPAAGEKFVGWTGSITASGSIITFTMAEGMQLHANFAPE